jgi:hypothetical protein
VPRRTVPAPSPQVRSPHARTLAEALLKRVPALTDELVERITSQVDIYGVDSVVGIDELREAVGYNLLSALHSLADHLTDDSVVPRQVGRRRAEQGAPLAAVMSSYQIGSQFIWEAAVAEARRSGISDTDLVDIGHSVWRVQDRFITEMAAAYRDTLSAQVLAREQERSALVEALLDGRLSNTSTVWEAADMLGLPYHGSFVVVAAEVPAVAKQALFDIENRLRARDIGSAWRLLPDLHVGIVSLRSVKGVATLVDILRTATPTGRVGVSPVYSILEQTPRSLHLARVALAISHPVVPAVNVFDDSPLPVLVASSPTTSYRVAKTVLGKLLETDPEDRDMLLMTLEAFFEVSGSAVEAGKRLFCHPNTVRHRLHRVEQQTGRSLNNPRDSAELYIALEALRRLPEPPTNEEDAGASDGLGASRSRAPAAKGSTGL